MTTMSDDGDRTCPLCAEEMDLTDQQLKPCKCGYEVCVWCWHHIMEMAEKEGSEGRCPACRTVYDKQRIVGMAADCKRMVAEVSAEKKQKSQKPKTKSSSTIEDRKHLSSVRVVQRNLVYIMGMPSNLADENILERKEYFGQYGKILKVSVSRQNGTPPQQAANSNTFSVYITYAREDEAIRCIQAVHNFVLEGKPLRACFGTTKYCYTWLRNMTCSNPDCLYLHDIGSHEDSFTKDEIISAYTRSRVPQIPLNNLQPRAGSLLPPPVDDLHNNGAVSSRHSPKNSFNNTSDQSRSFPIETSGPKSTALPAAASWGLRASSYRSSASSLTSSPNPLKQTSEHSNSSSNSSVISSINQHSAWHDDAITTLKMPESRPTLQSDARSRLSESAKHGNGKDHLAKGPDGSAGCALEVDHSSRSAWDDDVTVAKTVDGKQTVHINERPSNVETPRPPCVASVRGTEADVVLDEARHSAWDDDTVTTSNMPERQIVHNDDKLRSSENLESGTGLCRTSKSDATSKASPDAVHSSGVPSSCSPGLLSSQLENSVRGFAASVINSETVNITHSVGAVVDSSSSSLSECTHGAATVNGDTEYLSLGLSSVNLNHGDHVNMGQQQGLLNDSYSIGSLGNLNSRLQQHHTGKGSECLNSVPASNASVIHDAHFSGKLSVCRSELRKQAVPSDRTALEDALTTDDQNQRLPPVSNLVPSSPYRTYSSSGSNHLPNSFHNSGIGDKQFSVDGDARNIRTKMNRDEGSLFLNGHDNFPGSFVKAEKVFEYSNTRNSEKGSYLSGVDKMNNIERTATIDTEEESIVSKVLSSDFDPWDNSWSSANNFAKLLAQMNKQEDYSRQSSSWKPQSTNQSRFSFARQENQPDGGDGSNWDIGPIQKPVPLKQELYGKNSFGNAFPIGNSERLNVLGNSSSTISSETTAGATRTKVSAPPPGFSIPNRPPPPGFSSQDRYEPTFSTCPETQMLPSALQNQFQGHSTNIAGDVEFIDPAILAVGKGRLHLGASNAGVGSRSAFLPQFNNSDSDPRIQLLMQPSISSQDLRLPNHIGDRFLQLDDTYSSSRFSAQPHVSPFTHISHQQPSHVLNSQWNGWNDVQIGNGMGVPEVLRRERLGLSNYFPVNEDPKFLPNSNDIYNKAYGM